MISMEVLFSLPLAMLLFVASAQEQHQQQESGVGEIGACTTLACQQEALYQQQRVKLHEMRMDVFEMIQALQRSVHEEEYLLNELIRQDRIKQQHQQQQQQQRRQGHGRNQQA